MIGFLVGLSRTFQKKIFSFKLAFILHEILHSFCDFLMGLLTTHVYGFSDPILQFQQSVLQVFGSLLFIWIITISNNDVLFFLSIKKRFVYKLLLLTVKSPLLCISLNVLLCICLKAGLFVFGVTINVIIIVACCCGHLVPWLTDVGNH